MKMFMVWNILFLLLSLLPHLNLEMKLTILLSIILISKASFIDSQTEFNFFFLDPIGLSMAHLSLILTSLSSMVYMKQDNKSKEFLCLLSGLIAFWFFQTNNLMMFFILFEFSLIPLVILIMGWGKQPERTLASKYIMIYTLLSSIPLLVFIIFMEKHQGSFSMSNLLISSDFLMKFWPDQVNKFICTSFLMAFLMKVPIFFMHSWLPKAHVEAPLEGSIILAGIMLKVGTFGIIRMMLMFPSSCIFSMSSLIFSISLIGSIYSILMAVSSDDLKLSIALSSVSHMNFLVSGLMSMKELITPMSNFIMVSHGFSSSMLFFFVTIIYETGNSRSLTVVKGLMSKHPSLLLFSFFFFSLSTAIPPSLPFLGEMITISSIWMFSAEIVPMTCIFILFNSFYTMMNYGILNQSPSTKSFHPTNMPFLFNMKSILFSLIMASTFFFPESIL